ncbi:hypothetical protein T4E_7737 [Trichinella pseudospiralis]|uniref:Uncharacterized protein n=1 Tax=Trichinella pseudospiralis TaxID=6337 RepID=A0A0V0Y9Z1_TRIPS|nr:hypothetical protein T4E_7737 [Trichinella pseudospiralis]
MPDWKLAVFERASGAVDLCRSKGTFVSALSFDWGVCVTDLFFNNEFDPAHSYCSQGQLSSTGAAATAAGHHFGGTME